MPAASPSPLSTPVTSRIPGLVVTDHTFEVPLDHASPEAESIEVFAREVRAPGEDAAKKPWLLYLQGGPGFGGPRPAGPGGGWIERAVRDFRVLLLDQRGTGRSTTANRQTLPSRGDAAQQAEYLAHFRTVDIVRDAELIRKQLAGDEPWTVLGQSFGGFCTVSYLSFAPEGMRRALICGGLPSLDAHAVDVYRAAYPRMLRKNEQYYTRYPQDVEPARRIVARLAEREVVLPNGMLLTPEAFQSLGLMLGMGDGFDRMHYLLEDAFISVNGEPELSDAFLENAQNTLSFAAHPLYALVHETACYSQGPATGWAAERVRGEFPQFDHARTLAGQEPLLFTGETIHPWHFAIDPALRPLKDTADALAARENWSPLYDAAALARNEVPAAAVVYAEDLYVDAEHSSQTALQIKGLRRWITNEYEHDGVRVSGDAVFERLLKLADGEL